jgi:PAS domain S-box-containing protein
MKLAQELDELSADILPALDELAIVAFLVDAEGRIRWTSRRGAAIWGDVRGRPAETVVAPPHRSLVRTERAQKLLGVKRTSEFEARVLLPDGTTREAEFSSVALRSGERVVAIFGVMHVSEPVTPAVRRRVTPTLTPRQHQVLELLAAGRSTRQIAEELHLSIATVRNYVRAILSGLGGHSRLEALAIARREQLI